MAETDNPALVPFPDPDVLMQPYKAYKNMSWINSTEAQPVRVLCEFAEPHNRLARENVRNTILVFGSARAKSPDVHAQATRKVNEELAAMPEDHPDREDFLAQKDKLDRTAWMCDYYIRIAELTRRLTQWSLDRRDDDGVEPYVIASGGGPGIMEAANRGAASVPGGRSIGMAISLPFENRVNAFVTPELCFQFHYFSSRKFMMVYPSVALIIGPGGLGTLDELLEVLTLLQTGKIGGKEQLWKAHTPIVLMGVDYWKRVLNLEVGAELGVIAPKDIERLFYTDSVDEAFEHVTECLARMEKSFQEEQERDVATPSSRKVPALGHFENADEVSAAWQQFRDKVR